MKDCYHGDGSTYAGTQSTTINGYTCQRWDSNWPHLKKEFASDPNNFPEDSLSEAENYCRQPEEGETKPWCYTTNMLTRWDYCDIEKCSGKKINVVFRKEKNLEMVCMLA